MQTPDKSRIVTIGSFYEAGVNNIFGFDVDRTNFRKLNNDFESSDSDVQIPLSKQPVFSPYSSKVQFRDNRPKPGVEEDLYISEF